MAQTAEQVNAKLTALLSQRGALQLPFREDLKWAIRQHLSDLVQELPSLSIRDGNFVLEDGRQLYTLKAQGTIPMYYKGSKYNIPLAIWLPESYPRTPPHVYVEPTPDMVIKPQHSFVSPSGRVDVAYLREWTFQRSNLVDLCWSLGIYFGEDPPLFSKPPGWSPPPPAAHHEPFTNPMVRPGSGRPSGGPYAQAPVPSQQGPGPYPAPVAFQNPYAQHLRPPGSAQQPPPPPPPPGGKASAQAQVHAAAAAAPSAAVSPSKLAFRRAASAQLKERLKASFAAERDRILEQITKLDSIADELRQRHATLLSGLKAMEAERTVLERNVGAMSSKTAELDSWLSKHEEKAKSLATGGLGTGELEAAIVPADPLSAQALQAAAEDIAIEDTLYALERGLQAGIVEPEVYLKQVRRLCRKQFFPRALGAKIAASQKVERAARDDGERAGASNKEGGSTREITVPQGDTWSHGSGHFQRGGAAAGLATSPAAGWTNPLLPSH